MLGCELAQKDDTTVRHVCYLVLALIGSILLSIGERKGLIAPACGSLAREETETGVLHETGASFEPV